MAASYDAVLVATAAVVHQANMDMFERFVRFLDDKIELDDDLKALLDEFKATIEAPPVAPRKRVPKSERTKRPPSEYNKYISKALNELKEQHPEMSSKDRMREAIAKWKARASDSEPEPASTSATNPEVEEGLEDFIKSRIVEKEEVPKAKKGAKKTKKSTA